MVVTRACPISPGPRIRLVPDSPHSSGIRSFDVPCGRSGDFTIRLRRKRGQLQVRVYRRRREHLPESCAREPNSPTEDSCPETMPELTAADPSRPKAPLPGTPASATERLPPAASAHHLPIDGPLDAVTRRIFSGPTATLSHRRQLGTSDTKRSRNTAKAR